MAEKSEKATPKKLRDARKKGQVAKSQDLPAAFTFIVAIITSLSFAKVIYDEVGAYILGTFHAFRHTNDMVSTIINYLGYGLRIILKVTLPILIVTVFVGVLSNLVIVGPLFSFKVIPFLKKQAILKFRL